MKMMCPRVLSMLMLLACACLCAPLAAQTVLRGEVAVPSQEEAAVDAGLAQILAEVLQRVGGADATQGPQAAAALAKARDYAQSWTFRSETVLQDGVPTRLLYLQAGFDRRTLQALLGDTGLQAVATDAAPLAVAIEVGPLRSAEDFARALAALRALPIVRELSLAEALPDRLRLAATVAGGAAALLAGVDAGGVFRPLGTSPEDNATVMLELLP